MSFSIEELIEGNLPPVTIKQADSAQVALDLMVEHNYSQLPVVDDDGRPLGMVTSDSILRALSNFGVTIDALHVSSAVVKVHRFRPSDDLFDLLNDLRDNYAALIVDGSGRLIGVVTNYDTAEYFRRRAEDIMRVEDIETALKEHIQAAFATSSGEIDQSAWASAIEDVTDPKQVKYRLAASAIKNYLILQGEPNPTPNKKWIEQAVTQIDEKKAARTFDDLTFAEYTSLLFHKSQWGTYGKNFDLDAKALQKLLNDVRETRNILAHFRSELTPRQRDQLRFCSDWFERHPPAISVTLTAEDTARLNEKATVAVREAQTPYVVARPTDLQVTPTDEEITPSDSRYAPLALWLQSQPIGQDRVTFSFEQIEGILNNELPASARQHRSWWANDSVGHMQSKQWLEVGWRVSYINMTEGHITFARIKEREKAYIEFYSALLALLQERATPFLLRPANPDGHSWITVAWVPEGGSVAGPLSFSFSRNLRFRVELYIDTGDQGRNKQIFDYLFVHKGEIEASLGELVGWERLTDRRASRVALYRDGAITDDAEKLSKLQQWAADSVVRFYEAIRQPLNEAVTE